jgi:hypothetical protein
MSGRAWIETSQWTFELHDGDAVLGRAVRNGFNALAWGPNNENLGFWVDIDRAKQAVEQFARRDDKRSL